MERRAAEKVSSRFKAEGRSSLMTASQQSHPPKVSVDGIPRRGRPRLPPPKDPPESDQPGHERLEPNYKEEVGAFAVDAPAPSCIPTFEPPRGAPENDEKDLAVACLVCPDDGSMAMASEFIEPRGRRRFGLFRGLRRALACIFLRRRHP